MRATSTPAATAALFLSASTATPASFSVDANGNLYTKYSYSTNVCYLVEEPLYNAEYSPTSKRVAGGTACGFTGDGGLARSAEISSTIGQIAFDVAGNLYFADAGNQRIRRIDAITGIITTIAGNGTAGFSGDGSAATKATLSNPTGVAVDSQGQIYILSNAPTAGPTQALRKLKVNGYWHFGSVLKGTTTAPFVFTVANTGNDSLTLTSNASLTGANVSDYSIDPATTNCGLTAGSIILAGHSCTVGFVFKPTGTGTRVANLVLQDNTVNGSNTIVLNGTGTLPAPAFTITSPANGASVKTGTAITFSVSVTSTSGAHPTGTVQFLVDNANYGTPVTLSTTGTASTSVTGLTIASHTLSAKYSGDANYAAAGPISVSSVVTAAVKVPPMVTLSVAARPANTCSATQFEVTVSSDAGPVPTGAVHLLDGSSMLAAGSLSNGKALLSSSSLRPGLHTLTASYAGDELHVPAVSPALVEQISLLGSCTGPRILHGQGPHRDNFDRSPEALNLH
jgi:Bacterial Ig-like domain (group 3)